MKSHPAGNINLFFKASSSTPGRNLGLQGDSKAGSVTTKILTTLPEPLLVSSMYQIKFQSPTKKYDPRKKKQRSKRKFYLPLR